MRVGAISDVVEEVVALGDRELIVVRPRSSEDLLDEAAFAREEFLPYWAELWPSGVALARRVARRALRGATTLELGCGLGLPSVAAALSGGRVTATDWSEPALAFTRANAERNGARLDTVHCSWADPPAEVLDAAPWSLVLASDVLYEPRNGDALLEVLPRLVDERGEVWIADPGRPGAVYFLEVLDAARWSVETTRLPGGAGVEVSLHRLRRR